MTKHYPFPRYLNPFQMISKSLTIFWSCEESKLSRDRVSSLKFSLAKACPGCKIHALGYRIFSLMEFNQTVY